MSVQPKKSGKPQQANAVLRYSGMAFQFAVIIGLGVFAGKKLDAYFGFEKSVMMIICAMLALGVAFYLILKDVNRK